MSILAKSIKDKKIKYFLLAIIYLAPSLLIAQLKNSHNEDSLQKIAHKKILVGNSLAVIYGGSMAGLYNLWYKDYPQSAFHFYNDNNEWLNMDKVGHVFSAYTEGRYSIDMLKWAGFSQREANIAGPLYGYLYQTTIEVFDGFSSEWGFSGGDILANTIGSGLVMTQAMAWNQQKIRLKFSYSQGPLTKERPEIFGQNLLQNLFKDYNGQTYWVCLNPASFANHSHWPQWLDISLGYGAKGMYTGAADNILRDQNGIVKDYSSTPRRMQFYLSPDINLEKIKVKKKWIIYTLKILNTFKFPLPSLNFTPNEGFKFEPLKF